jgi:hypothetical protein
MKEVQVMTMPCGAVVAVQRVQRCARWRDCDPERRLACEIGKNGDPDCWPRPVRLVRDRGGEAIRNQGGEE